MTRTGNDKNFTWSAPLRLSPTQKKFPDIAIIKTTRDARLKETRDREKRIRSWWRQQRATMIKLYRITQ